MKIIHLSDLHIGKRVNEFSMLEDQQYILNEILHIIDKEKADAIIIAGDVYDKTIPPAEAVQLLDSFLSSLFEREIPTYIISGNHDSAERLSFGSKVMDTANIHISPVYNGFVEPFSLSDEYGKVNIYLLPFVKPVSVRRFFEEETIETYTDALSTAISKMNINSSERNVLVSHQFVTGASRSDSEDISIGGLDNVDVSVFDEFDYVALGHIHHAQKMSRDTVRYCGTPLKYSFSEVNDKKSVTVVNLYEKGKVELSTIPLIPLHDMREIKGKYEDLILKENYDGTNLYDYLHITLTNEDEVPDAMSRLRVIYPNIMRLDYDNNRTRNQQFIGSAKDVKKRSKFDLFCEFYEKQNDQQMSQVQIDFIKSLIEEIQEGNK